MARKLSNSFRKTFTAITSYQLRFMNKFLKVKNLGARDNIGHQSNQREHEIRYAMSTYC